MELAVEFEEHFLGFVNIVPVELSVTACKGGGRTVWTAIAEP
jgi:hypothetical protein